MALYGAGHERTIVSANNLGVALLRSNLLDEAKTFLERQLEISEVGPDRRVSLMLRQNLANALVNGSDPTDADDFRAEALMRDVVARSTRVFGARHPQTVGARAFLDEVVRAIEGKLAGSFDHL